jgi:hypothetical protein
MSKPEIVGITSAESGEGIESPVRARHRFRKKKARYSDELGDVQKLDRRLTKAETRVTRAVLAGLETWQTRSNRSAKKGRDGALRDALDNGARAYARSVEKAARATRDVVDLFYPYSK